MQPRRIRLWKHCWICPKHRCRLPSYDPNTSPHWFPVTDSDQAYWRAAGRCCRTQTYRGDPTCPCLATPIQVTGKITHQIAIPLHIATDRKIWATFRTEYQKLCGIEAEKELVARQHLLTSMKDGTRLTSNLVDLCMQYLYCICIRVDWEGIDREATRPVLTCTLVDGTKSVIRRTGIPV